MVAYCLQNKINNKTYVGISSYSFNKRKTGHLSKLRNNKHNNDYLQRSFDKYGEENFEWIILEKGFNDIDELCDAEEFWIDTLQSMSYQHGYNLKFGGYAGRHTEATKQKMSENKDTLSVLQYTKLGEFVAEYSSVMEASRQTDINHSHICGCCINREYFYTAGGYQWFYKDGFNEDDVENLVLKERKKKAEVKTTNTITVYQYNLNGDYMREWDWAGFAADFYDIDKDAIYACARGDLIQSGGFQWEYEKKEKLSNVDWYEHKNCFTCNKKFSELKTGKDDSLFCSPDCYYEAIKRSYVKLNKNGDIVKEYKSLRTAFLDEELKAKEIVNSCMTGELVNGYKWGVNYA